MEKKLNELKVKEKGIVKRVEALGLLRKRLFDMGVTPGVEIEFKKVAPLLDPIEITLRGYELTLRKDEAKCIIVEVCE